MVSQDFSRFDFILAMDQRNLQWLQERCPAGWSGGLSLLGSWAPDEAVGEIPDPYYGTLAGFEQVMSRLHAAMQGFLPALLEELASAG